MSNIIFVEEWVRERWNEINICGRSNYWMMVVMRVDGYNKWLNVSNKRIAKHCNRISHVCNSCKHNVFLSFYFVLLQNLILFLIFVIFSQKELNLQSLNVCLKNTPSHHMVALNMFINLHLHKSKCTQMRRENTIANRKKMNSIDGNVSTKAHQMPFQMKSFGQTRKKSWNFKWMTVGMYMYLLRCSENKLQQSHNSYANKLKYVCTILQLSPECF